MERRQEKISSLFQEVQLTAPAANVIINNNNELPGDGREEPDTGMVRTQRQRSMPALPTSIVYRQRTSLSSADAKVSNHKTVKPEPDWQLDAEPSMSNGCDHSLGDFSPKYRDSTKSVLSESETESEAADDDSSSEYDTDLEEACTVKRCDPPTSSIKSQEAFYRAMCAQLHVLPLSAYIRRLDRPQCILAYCKISDKDSKPLATTLQVSHSITKLSLRENLFSECGVAYISQMIQGNSSITHLDLSENQRAFTEVSAIRELCGALITNKTVKILNLSATGIDDRKSLPLSLLIKKSERLEELVLSHNSISNEGGIQLGRGLAANKSLRRLDLSWNHLRQAGAGQFVLSLKENRKLEVLNLHMNGLGDLGAGALAGAIRVNKSLREIDIRNNRISVAGAVHMGRCCAVNKTLTVLKMGTNPIQVQGSYAFIKSLEKDKGTNLKQLDLTGVTVLDKFMESVLAIRTVKPEFTVCVGRVVPSAVRIEAITDKGISSQNPLVIVVNYMESQRMRIVDLFKTWDTDNSLSLSRDEFKEGLKSVDTPLTESQLDELIQTLDKDGDGEIELGELSRAIDVDYKEIRRKAIKQFKGNEIQQTSSKKRDELTEILDEVNSLMEESEKEPLSISMDSDEYIRLCQESVVAADGREEAQGYRCSSQPVRKNSLVSPDC